MIKIIRCSLASLALAMALVSSGTAVAADIKAGEKVFKKCKACHYADREKHKTGPHLVEIIGRTAGSVEDYKKYSKAMKASGIVWDETTLADYLRAPKKFMPGTKMPFAGIKKDEDIIHLIVYLSQFGPDGAMIGQ